MKKSKQFQYFSFSRTLPLMFTWNTEYKTDNVLRFTFLLYTSIILAEYIYILESEFVLECLHIYIHIYIYRGF